ncbi:MAG: serine--tRNA ligase [Candidatus Paceibacterota bacterium]
MLDINFIRENKDAVIEGAKKKGVVVDIQALLDLDDQRKKIQHALDQKREEQNKAAKKIASAPAQKREELIKASTTLKEEVKKLEADLQPVKEQWQKLMWQVPQVPHESVPEGKSDADNKEVKAWGKKPEFKFEPKDHVELMTSLNMVDFERGAAVHGFRGYFLKNDGALLSWAIWNYAQDFFLKKGFNPMLVPAIVKEQNLYGTGHLPNDVEDIYKTQDDDFLSGTAEVATMGYFADQVLDLKTEQKVLAFSPCYRREAGSHGKDTKGLIRVHEFYKLEQVVISKADEAESQRLHDWLNRNTEEFIESLGIPYHTVLNCAGDLGLGQRKKYDIELWVPQENKYREISSASYFNDFQTRRFNIKYKNDAGKLEFAHSLNCTAIPTPRILVSLVENFQTAKGTIMVPKPLRKYLGKKEIK